MRWKGLEPIFEFGWAGFQRPHNPVLELKGADLISIPRSTPDGCPQQALGQEILLRKPS